jgi:hypothetical protein
VAGLEIPSPRDQPSNNASALRTSRGEEKSSGSAIVRRGIAMASPRNWLGKKEDKEGTHTHAHAHTHTHARTRPFPLPFVRSFLDRCVLSAN